MEPPVSCARIQGAAKSSNKDRRTRFLIFNRPDDYMGIVANFVVKIQRAGYGIQSAFQAPVGETAAEKPPAVHTIQPSKFASSAA